MTTRIQWALHMQLAAILWVAMVACSSSTATNSGTPSCMTGSVLKYDSTTGKPYCAVAGADTGSLDSVTTADVGGGVDSTTPPDAGPKTDAADAAGPQDVGADVAKSDPFQCPVETANPALGKHGVKCTQNSDCMYGSCVFGSPLSGYDSTIGFCTKNCGCTGTAAVCSTDDIDMNTTFKCVMEKTALGGNPKRDGSKPVTKMCARACQKDDECVAWNPELPNCMTFSNDYVSIPSGICGKTQP